MKTRPLAESKTGGRKRRPVGEEVEVAAVGRSFVEIDARDRDARAQVLVGLLDHRRIADPSTAYSGMVSLSIVNPALRGPGRQPARAVRPKPPLPRTRVVAAATIAIERPTAAPSLPPC